MLSKVNNIKDHLVLRWGTMLESWVLFFLLTTVLFVSENTIEKTPQSMVIEWNTNKWTSYIYG